MLTVLELEAARYRLGLVTGQSLVQAAMATLSEGVSTVDIAYLAGETDPLLRDAGPLFEKALDELGGAIAGCRPRALDSTEIPYPTNG